MTSIVVGDRVSVPFAGEGSGVGPLSWGQQSIWAEMARAGKSLTMTAVRPLEPGATVAEFVEEFRFYLSRYEAMRTLLRFEPDGRIVQVVRDSGTAEIEIYDAGDQDPAEVAAAIDRHYTATRFDYEHDWPIRMALVRWAGALSHMVLTLAHHMADPTSAMAMFEDLANRDPATGEAARSPGIQPLAQARLQQTPSALRQNAAALRYWEEQLRVIAPTMFPGPAARDRDPAPARRYWEADFVSPAMYHALRIVAARLGAPTGAVLYAAFAQALARATGVDHVATTITVNSRFRPGLANAGGHMSQHGLCTLATADAPFDELVRRARRRLLVAQKNAYYAQDDVDELIARVGRERGVTFDLLCLFNDRRAADRPSTDARLPAELPAELPATTLSWRPLDGLHQRLMLHVGDGPDAVAALLQADTDYLGRDDLAALLWRMEAAVVDALVF